MIKYANLKNYPKMDLAGHCPIFKWERVQTFFKCCLWLIIHITCRMHKIYTAYPSSLVLDYRLITTEECILQ